MNDKVVSKFLPFVNLLRKYHSHEIFGMHNIPNSGKALIVLNHSLATYDIALLFAAIYQETGRYPRPIADHWFFKIPYLKEFAEETGAIEGKSQKASALLNEGNIVAVAPGGMREALRPSEERYQILWNKRKGFIKLAYKTQTPIILAMCPKADDIYFVYKNSITSFFYKNYKLPIFLARGLGPTLLPRPVKLQHFLSEAIIPPPYKESNNHDELINKFHKKVIKKSQELMSEGIYYRK